jgi:hypothetical protein
VTSSPRFTSYVAPRLVVLCASLLPHLPYHHSSLALSIDIYPCKLSNSMQSTHSSYDDRMESDEYNEAAVEDDNNDNYYSPTTTAQAADTNEYYPSYFRPPTRASPVPQPDWWETGSSSSGNFHNSEATPTSYPVALVFTILAMIGWHFQGSFVVAFRVALAFSAHPFSLGLGFMLKVPFFDGIKSGYNGSLRTRKMSERCDSCGTLSGAHWLPPLTTCGPRIKWRMKCCGACCNGSCALLVLEPSITITNTITTTMVWTTIPMAHRGIVPTTTTKSCDRPSAHSIISHNGVAATLCRDLKSATA